MDLVIGAREAGEGSPGNTSSPESIPGINSSDQLQCTHFASNSPSRAKQLEKIRRAHQQRKLFTEGYERVITLKTAENMAVSFDKRRPNGSLDRERERIPQKLVTLSTELSNQVLKRIITSDTLDTDVIPESPKEKFEDKFEFKD